VWHVRGKELRTWRQHVTSTRDLAWLSLGPFWGRLLFGRRVPASGRSLDRWPAAAAAARAASSPSPPSSGSASHPADAAAAAASVAGGSGPASAPSPPSAPDGTRRRGTDPWPAPTAGVRQWWIANRFVVFSGFSGVFGVPCVDKTLSPFCDQRKSSRCTVIQLCPIPPRRPGRGLLLLRIAHWVRPVGRGPEDEEGDTRGGARASVSAQKTGRRSGHCLSTREKPLKRKMSPTGCLVERYTATKAQTNRERNPPRGFFGGCGRGRRKKIGTCHVVP